MDNVVALEEGMPAREQAFDSLSSLRSELLNRPHLPNEEDTSIITSMVADLNEGVMTAPLTQLARLIFAKQRLCILRMIFAMPLLNICLDQKNLAQTSAHP
jgi:hypothetical protein